VPDRAATTNSDGRNVSQSRLNERKFGRGSCIWTNVAGQLGTTPAHEAGALLGIVSARLGGGVLHDRPLHQNELDAGRSEDLKRHLAAMGRFHRYSLLCVPQRRCIESARAHRARASALPYRASDTTLRLVTYFDRDMELVWTPKHLDKMSWHRSSSVQLSLCNQNILSFQRTPQPSELTV
jgi:hypothetical protein